MIYDMLVSIVNFEVESLFSRQGIQQVRFGSHFTNDLVMNSIHFLIPKVLIALTYINIDPVLKAGFTNSQENFYGRLAILVANLLGKFRGAIFDGLLRHIPNVSLSNFWSTSVRKFSWFDLRCTFLPTSKFIFQQFSMHICWEIFVERSSSTKEGSVQELPSLFITD